MPKIDKGTQLIKIPRVNEVEGLPLPEGVQHVSSVTVITWFYFLLVYDPSFNKIWAITLCR